ncbi:hypothetical protein GDO81_012569 [Engystomops pustulosus]|uniref:Uncharacterized protein n=1 Tax=Engystomops pustulosus TaxID=76066 RepID=A0AAV7BMC2_ENGPU|nr:hypothetical protein GDO81_012569 [Engystomops pustulosus]
MCSERPPVISGRHCSADTARRPPVTTRRHRSSALAASDRSPGAAAKSPDTRERHMSWSHTPGRLRQAATRTPPVTFPHR